MIPSATATPDTMRRSLAFSIAALDAAADLDLELTDENRALMATEKTNLVPLLDRVLAAQKAMTEYFLKEGVILQARVLLGDASLDRCVRLAKARMKVELQTKKADAADYVFGANLHDIVDAEMRLEPSFVLQCVARFDHVPDFPGKDALRKDLEARANRQIKLLAERDAGEMKRQTLSNELEHSIADASEELYRLEKRLLDRFPREKSYVRQFFVESQSTRKPLPSEPSEPSEPTS